MNLIIVESPTKAKTIGQFLGKEYQVESSFGHIRDLPKSKLGIDIENNFQPQYVIPLKSRKIVNQLKKLAQKAEGVILATDEDREGEAIAWHLTEALGSGKRIAFHEITEKAIREALKNPREIDMNLVDSQQTRRILDRLVGYKLSPFLWEKVAKRLSAGRVQSVALRFIAERENEIRNFKPEEYWTIAALLSKIKDRTIFEAIFQWEIKTEAEAQKITNELKTCEFKVNKIEKKQIKRNPPAPFTTSTLQQEAIKRLRLTAKQTMFFSQGLYEKGLITYMRTDSLNLSQESLAAAKTWIKNNLGENYAVQAPRVFKTKSRLAQEAHEAIRPTNPQLMTSDIINLNEGEKKIYDLIWRRFISSQLPQAIFDATHVEIVAKNPLITNDYLLITNGNILCFDGFLKIWTQKFQEKELPELKENEILKLKEIKPEQHFTEPPARYNEATLIKTLEEYGIGRPSTYAPIISVIQERNYVQKNPERRFEPTAIGELVNKVLTEHFPKIVDIKFTAEMEEKLDEIAQGQKKWSAVIKEFYGPFAENLEQKYQEVEKQKPAEEKTQEVCEKCGKPMVIKFGRFGRFLACSGFPDCKNAKPLYEKNKKFGPCPKCQSGEIIRRRTKKGRYFYGCSRYPDCDFAAWKLSQKEKPPELTD
jgi:DNA topoisomerase-1